MRNFKEMVLFSVVTRYDDYAILSIDSDTYGHHDFYIDLDDADKVSKYTWSVMRARRNEYNGEDVGYGSYYYASSCKCYKETKHTLLHRYIMNAPKNMLVDHIDRDTHNMRKYNMRLCDRITNSLNKKMPRHNTSGYRGVIFYDYGTMVTHPKWYAFLTYKKRKIHLGYFENIEDAIQARRDGEIKYYGHLIDENE